MSEGTPIAKPDPFHADDGGWLAYCIEHPNGVRSWEIFGHTSNRCCARRLATWLLLAAAWIQDGDGKGNS